MTQLEGSIELDQNENPVCLCGAVFELIMCVDWVQIVMASIPHVKRT
jgi:hypothetical protein